MRRTGPAALLGAAVAGGAIAWLVQVALASGGAPSFVPPATLWTVLVVVAVALLLLGRPVRRLVRGRAKRRVDPLFAMRVLVLAKASSLIGALLVGFGVVLLVYAVSRTGSIATAGFWPAVLTTAAALVLGIAGLIVEQWCRIPPQDRSDAADRLEERR